MDSLFALKGQDFILVAGESTIMQSIFKLKSNFDKSLALDTNILLAMAGEHADREIRRLVDEYRARGAQQRQAEFVGDRLDLVAHDLEQDGIHRGGGLRGYRFCDGRLRSAGSGGDGGGGGAPPPPPPQPASAARMTPAAVRAKDRDMFIVSPCRKSLPSTENPLAPVAATARRRKHQAGAQVRHTDANPPQRIRRGLPIAADIGEQAGPRGARFVEQFITAAAVEAGRRRANHHGGPGFQPGERLA